MRDVKRFAVFAAGRELDKGLLLAYKVHLEEHYAIRSANSMLAAEARSNCRLSLVLQTLCGAQTDVPLTMPVDCRQHYVEGIGQLCAHCAQRAAGETPNK